LLQVELFFDESLQVTTVATGQTEFIEVAVVPTTLALRGIDGCVHHVTNNADRILLPHLEFCWRALDTLSSEEWSLHARTRHLSTQDRAPCDVSFVSPTKRF